MFPLPDFPAVCEPEPDELELAGAESPPPIGGENASAASAGVATEAGPLVEVVTGSTVCEEDDVALRRRSLDREFELPTSDDSATGAIIDVDVETGSATGRVSVTGRVLLS